MRPMVPWCSGTERGGAAGIVAETRSLALVNFVDQSRGAQCRAPDVLQVSSRGMLVRKRITGEVSVRNKLPATYS
jgi:hypothetical protein